ncbi:sigma-70 family RNA polymerase sigma factor [Desulfobacterota bacterium AH_259_B03_O07]|nr:sigma-70 family RNA polymerase sigma factor [Desulfobacterota bacterium AH_259_B03_O07]
MSSGFIKGIFGLINRGDENKSDSSYLTDGDLVQKFVNENNQAALGEIFNRYVEKVYGIALRITGNPSYAEEVLQEVFLTLIKKAHTFRGEAKLSSWVYRVTVNASFMHLRAEKKYESNVSLDNYVPYDEKGTLMGKIKAKDWSSRPDIIIFSKEALETIEKSVNELPESFRIVYHLRDVEGLSNEEISKILDLSVPAVKSRLHRARLFLRDRLSDYFDEWRKIS